MCFLNDYSKSHVLVLWIALIITLTVATLLPILIDYRFLLYAFFLLVVISVIVLAIFYSLKTKGYLDILSPYIFFPVMYLVVYGVGPHKALTVYGDEIGNKVLLVISLGFIFFMLGSILASTLLMNNAAKKNSLITTTNNGSIRDKRLQRMFKFSVFIGIVALVMFFVNARGIPFLMSDLENSRVEALSGNGIPYYFSMFIMIGVWIYFIKSQSTKSKIIVLTFGVGLMLMTGWRNTAVALLLISILLYHYQKPIALKKLLFIGSLLIVIISVTGLYRIYSSDLQHYELMKLMNQGKYIQSFFQYLYNYPVVFTDNLILVLEGFNDSSKFLYGASFFWNFMLIIPWVEAEAFDFYLKDYLQVGFAGGGLPPTLLGDFFLNFGVIGIIIGMIFVGFLWKIIHHLFLLNKGNLVGLASVIILYYLSVSVRGGIENITLTVTWLLVALSIAFFSTKFVFVRK
ncbi:oligosaccharide repeat unit polymerase [Alkalicoccobacillus gibsonii]|uniref:oligosaccharide repeat unit polymerase n=1 Tax=Alkalicoccobacillus gibsonii TaxID=79881 RepID=UPI003511E9CC